MNEASVTWRYRNRGKIRNKKKKRNSRSSPVSIVSHSFLGTKLSWVILFGLIVEIPMK